MTKRKPYKQCVKQHKADLRKYYRPFLTTSTQHRLSFRYSSLLFVCVTIGSNKTHYKLVTRKGDQDSHSTYASLIFPTPTINLLSLSNLACTFGRVVRGVCCLFFSVSFVVGAWRKMGLENLQAFVIYFRNGILELRQCATPLVVKCGLRSQLLYQPNVYPKNYLSLLSSHLSILFILFCSSASQIPPQLLK